MTSQRPKTGMASLGEAKFEIGRSQLPRGDVQVIRRVARVAHRRGASVSCAYWFFILFNGETLKMLRVASPSRGRTHNSHSPRSTPSLNGEEVQCGVVARVRSAARAAAVGPAGLFVYDNNNGTHRNA